MDRILVIGGTGMLGAPVARRLLEDGFTVRIFSRDPAKGESQLGPGFEWASGDVENLASLEKAVVDCTAVHINLRGGHTTDMLERIEHRGMANVARIAAQCGVRRISFLSYAAELKNYPDVPYARSKLLGEQAIIQCGVPYMIFRATHFMESLKFYFKNGRAYIIGNQPHRFHWCAADDYARMVAQAHKNLNAYSKGFCIFGPEAWTMREALEIFCRARGIDTPVSTLPFWVPRLIGALTLNPEMKFASDLMRFFSAAGEQGDPTETNQLLGSPKTTLQRWSETSAIL